MWFELCDGAVLALAPRDTWRTRNRTHIAPTCASILGSSRFYPLIIIRHKEPFCPNKRRLFEESPRIWKTFYFGHRGFYFNHWPMSGLFKTFFTFFQEMSRITAPPQHFICMWVHVHLSRACNSFNYFRQLVS